MASAPYMHMVHMARKCKAVMTSGNEPHSDDVECGLVVGTSGGWAGDDNFNDPFDIATTKNASVDTLKRWRQAALVLNASRRFWYTLDLRKEEDKEQRRRMIRAHAQVIRAALLFKLAGQRAIVLGTTVTPPSPSGDYGIALEQLASTTREHNISALQQYGGIIIVEFLGKFTSTVKLDWSLWLVSLAMGLFSCPLAIVGKLIPVPETPLAKVFIKPYQRCIATRNA